ncbi:MAG: hypothetical protein U0S12_15640 [Fimbriimonadales bacterium]
MNENLELHALADGALDADAQAQIAREVGESAELQRELSSIHAVKGALSKCESHDCAKLWKSCQARLDEVDRAKRVQNIVGRYAWALCSIFFVFIVGAAMLNRSKPSTVGANDLAYMASSVPLASGQSGRYLEKLGSDAPNVTPDRIDILGSGEGFVNGYHVVAYDLRDDQGRMKLMMANVGEVTDCESTMGCYKMFRMGDANAVVWYDNGWSVTLIGNRSREDLCKVAETIKGSR